MLWYFLLSLRALGSRTFSASPSNLSVEVPVLDLSDPDDVLVPQVAAACSEWGFFQVGGSFNLKLA